METAVKGAQQRKHLIATSMNHSFTDPAALRLQRQVKTHLGFDVEAIKIKRLYLIEKGISTEQAMAIGTQALADPIVEAVEYDPAPEQGYDWTIQIFFKPGVTDNAGETAKTTIEDYLGEHFAYDESVHSGTQYLIKGALKAEEVRAIAETLIANRLIETISIIQHSHREHFYDTIDLSIDDDALMALSNERSLALNLKEMCAIRDFYSSPKTINERKEAQLPTMATDVELEALAQTWSEHCKHKIFNAKIRYTCDGITETIDSLFSTYIKKATKEIANNIDWLVSVFSDNAGIIRFNDTYDIAFKVETHNSPSALDPYGGALTGILGVNRDIMGAGIGARLVANTDIFCFADPCYEGNIPERLLHPRRIFEGVRLGVEHGGNKSGVPTVNGAIVFDNSYLGKPLVYCGTVGILPHTINGKPSAAKEIVAGDLIVVAGGRTGKDGIHGATFSSQELHADSPSSAVQIGNPYIQKKLHDFIMDARDKGLYRTLTDNGAGGISSSVGELAQLSNGCEVHLDAALLKNQEMKPWEILVSESQERMTFALPPENEEAFKAIARSYEIELSFIGTFTASGNFHILYNNTTVGLLPLAFLHGGVPQLELEAEWENIEIVASPSAQVDPNEALLTLLSRYNICSKESVIRQYDHEVQGGSVIKPLCGIALDGPSDAAVVRPLECMEKAEYALEGIVIANGICPKFSSIDCYEMAASAIDEALRNLVAVGGNPAKAAILDNFCWPDPIYDPAKTPDGKHKLAQLVRANKALYDYATAFGTPIISGKDSMKNDYKIGSTKISILPTLLISIIGKIDDVTMAVTMDPKCVGDLVYVIGVTKDEMGASEYALAYEEAGGIPPSVDAAIAKKTYMQLHEAMKSGLVVSCHDCSDGGLACALAECVIASKLGMEIYLPLIPQVEGLEINQLLFSESNSRFVVTINPADRQEFEALMNGISLSPVGKVTDRACLTIQGLSDEMIVNIAIDTLTRAWKAPLMPSTSEYS